MKLNLAISSTQMEAVINVFKQHLDQSAINSIGNTAENFVSAINDCCSIIKNKAQEETDVNRLSLYRDHVKFLVDVKADLNEAIADNNQKLDHLRGEINSLLS